jgi:hypothetical protein
VSFIGDAMAAVVQGVEEVRTLLGQPPVVVGGLAVMCRLSRPYRATTDLDVVDRLLGATRPCESDVDAVGAGDDLVIAHGRVRVDHQVADPVDERKRLVRRLLRLHVDGEVAVAAAP